MKTKFLCIFVLALCLQWSSAFPQQGAERTSTSMSSKDHVSNPTICYFVNGQPLCGEEGRKAREADRERVRQMRDQLRQNTAGEESGSQRGRGDPDFLPQGDSPYQDDGPVSHPRNQEADNYKGHVRPNNNKGHVVPPPPPPTTKKPCPPPTTPKPTRKPCPPPTTTPRPCPPKSTTTTASPCQQKVTTPSPCPYATTDHPDIAEWKRTQHENSKGMSHRNSRPSYQALGSFQSDQNQLPADQNQVPAYQNQQSSDFLQNRQAWISASSQNQNTGIQSDQPIQGNSNGWWVPNKPISVANSRHSQSPTIFRSSRTFENDHAGVSRIPEIDVGRNGVMLSVIGNDERVNKQSIRQGEIQRSVGTSKPSEPVKLESGTEGKLTLYQYFQKKIIPERNSKLGLNNF